MSAEQPEVMEPSAEEEAQSAIVVKEEVSEEMGEQPQPDPEVVLNPVLVSPPAPVDVIDMAAQTLHSSRVAVQDAKDAIPAHDEAHNLLVQQRATAQAEVNRIDTLIGQSADARMGLEAKIEDAEGVSAQAAQAMIRVLQDYLDSLA